MPASSSSLVIVGLGYVGLPLAHAFARAGYDVTGYDVNEERIAELQNGHDRTDEVSDAELAEVSIRFSADPAVIGEADIVILAIPTPVDEEKRPDLTLLREASETVGAHMQEGAIVVYESTVYPGTTEEVCGPILEEASDMSRGEDFSLGYSPERINPGDRKHRIEDIIKIVAGQDEQTTDTLCKLYGSIVGAGIHRAPSIKVAEMAKAIENAQRDLNIAFVNEVALLCHKIGIPTNAVLEAAGTKWNFLPFQPGLVGGHCIGVDPYYLVEKARQLNMNTHVITAGRSVNDQMDELIAGEVVENLPSDPEESRVLVMGLTFKENIPDTRNSQSFAVIERLREAGCTVLADDPHAQDHECETRGIERGSLRDGPFDAVLLLVKHKEYEELGTKPLIEATKEGGIIYDVKSILNGSAVSASGRTYIAL